MLQTLFYIPDQIAGYPVFGAGILLALWAISAAGGMIWLLRHQGFNADTRGYAGLLLVIGAVIWLVLPRLVEPGKGLPIRGYGMMMLLGVVAGVLLGMRRARQAGLDPEIILGIAFWMVVPGIIGARLLYVIIHWAEFWRVPAGALPADVLPAIGATLVAILNVAQGGLAVYGSLIGGLLGLVAFVRVYRLPLLATFDLMMPSLLLGLAIGRVGCFLNGCCFGGACSLPWAVQFPPGSPPYQQQVQRGQLALPKPGEVHRGEVFLHGLKVTGQPDAAPVIVAVEPGSGAARAGLKPGQSIAAINGQEVATVEDAQKALLYAYQAGPTIVVTTHNGPAVARWRLSGPPAHSLPIHPTQLYQTVDALILCFLLLAYDPFRRRDGELLALLLTVYPITRFLMEMIRTDEPGLFGTSLSIFHWVSLAILVAVVPLWYVILRRPPGKAFPLPPSGPAPTAG